MTLRDDGQGVLFRDDRIKLYYPSHSWNMKALFTTKTDISIITHNFDDLEAIINQINNRETGEIRILCNSTSSANALAFKQASPKIQVRHKPSISARIFLRSDGRIYISSENIGRSEGLGVSVGFKSETAYKAYIKKVFNPEWLSAQPVN